MAGSLNSQAKRRRLHCQSLVLLGKIMFPPLSDLDVNHPVLRFLAASNLERTLLG